VNSVLFSNNGQYILTGSDDCQVHLYHTYSGQCLEKIKTAHSNNIFYAKELPSHTNLQAGDDAMDWILTCAADGKVFLHHRPTKTNQLIYRHAGRAHRIAIPSATSYSSSSAVGSLYQDVPGHFYTCGEDGICCLFDLRDYQRSSFIANNNNNHRNHGNSSLEESTIRRREMLTPEIKIELKNQRDRIISIYSIGVNPNNAYEIALSGEFGAVSLFDIRQSKQPFGYLCPEHCLSSVDRSHITGVKYTMDGKMLIASYNDENIYSFVIQDNQRSDLKSSDTSSLSMRRSTTNSSTAGVGAMSEDQENGNERDEDAHEDADKDADEQERDSSHDEKHSKQEQENEEVEITTTTNLGYYQKYIGHRNTDTVKQVSLFGNRSESVVSGSDCGHIFLWDIHSGQLLKVLKGDRIGAVNCLASHPILPLLATSGLEDDAKLWMPIGEHLPLTKGSEEYEKVTALVRRNGTGSSDFRERIISRVGLRRLLMMLTGGMDVFGDEDDDEGENGDAGDEDDEEEDEEGEEGDVDNPHSSESSHGSSGIRRAREEGTEESGSDSRQARRRRRTTADSGGVGHHPNVMIDLDEINAMLPILQSAWGRNFMTSEDSSNEDEDDDNDLDFDDDLAERYRGMYEEADNDSEDYDGEENEESESIGDDTSDGEDDETASTEWETCDSEDSQQDNQDDPFATDEEENA
jgi:WD repeat-containing protein 42A